MLNLLLISVLTYLTVSLLLLLVLGLWSLVFKEPVFPSLRKRSTGENFTLFTVAFLYLPLAIILHSKKAPKDLTETAKRVSAA